MMSEMTYTNFVERYKDKSYIGAGGFAKVYKVYDFANGHFVALKVADVRPELKQFTLQNEVEIVNHMPLHDNIIRYNACYRFNTGIAGDMDFAIMPFYEFGNLEQFLSQKTLSLEEINQIILGLLKGVNYLHQNNCIHRDLKAQNILIHRDNGVWIPKIADFGLSRYVTGTDQSLINSSIGMSLEYAAPEQIKNQKIYKNVDLWAVGILIYRIVANVSPFRGSKSITGKEAPDMEISRRIVNLELPAAFTTIMEPYQSMIRRCLVLAPRERVQSAEELIAMMKHQQLTPTVDGFIPAPINYSKQPLDRSANEPTHLAKKQHTEPGLKTRIVDQKTEVIPTKSQVKQEQQDAFLYTPPSYVPVPDYTNPRANVTQVFTPPSDEPPPAKQEERIRMSDSSGGGNKLWIYLPLFLIVLAASVWGLYWLLNPNQTPPSVIKSQPDPVVESSLLPPAFLSCFEEGKNVLGGTFRLIPTNTLSKTFATLDESCFDLICRELTTIKNGNATAKQFYMQAYSGDQCMKPVLEATLAYHNQQLSKLPLLALFYNSGQHTLSIDQKNELDVFLKAHKKTAKNKGLLIIGRASKKGNVKANKTLSRSRAERIIEFLKGHYIKKLDSDFVYFGAEPPQLNTVIAEQYGISKKKYAAISYGSGQDTDFSLRLNQSVLLVIYPKKDDPFDLMD